MELLHYSYEEAKRLLNEHREALDKIADYLIRRETITGKEFMKIFRAVERGMEIPENLDNLEILEEKDSQETENKNQKTEEQKVPDNSEVKETPAKSATVSLAKPDVEEQKESQDVSD